MPLTRRQQILIGFLTLFIITGFILYRVDHNIQRQIKEKSFVSPTQYFAAAPKYIPGQRLKPQDLKDGFVELNYRERGFGSRIDPGDFSLGESQECKELLEIQGDVFRCALFRPQTSKDLQLITFNEWDQILETHSGDPLKPVPFVEGEAKLFAQYLGNQPTSQVDTSLRHIPRYCLDAVLAIEDPQFLDHSGVSLRGMLRALATNLRQGRWSQGGSTITQQLVKNYFLTPEKTLWRKIKELLIAFTLEWRVSKDQILETYLNVIYLGQSGVFEVRGYGAAAQFYFNQQVEHLDLAQCALLAAIVNSPGRYHPVRSPERSQKRRERVLDKMLEQSLIGEDEYKQALATPLPQKVHRYLADSASYYVDAVNKQLKSLGVKERSGLKVFTALDPRAQRLAESVVQQGLDRLEKDFNEIKSNRDEHNKRIEGLLISSDPLSGDITALVGGRQFATSPYNRAIESRRQLGSIFKPIVYLTALSPPVMPGGMGSYSPTSLIDNSPLTHEWDGQSWSPMNYDKKFSTPVPLFYALKESLNVPTVRLGLEVGLDSIMTTAQSLGISSTMKAYPSLPLGSFEARPLEVLEAYNTFARMGLGQRPVLIKRVESSQGEELYRYEPEETRSADPVATAQLVGMMKETLRTGTGQSSRWRGFNAFAAGKTGTSSEGKDTWFAGFTPHHSAVVWVGYDDGTPMKLTGATAALPIWTNYMKTYTRSHPHEDFDWPPQVQEKVLSREKLLQWNLPDKKAQDTPLIFPIDENSGL